jgi:peptidoglycan/LPS O-acetylase OafA/YrhL
MREPLWDYIKGVSIVAVVCIHSCQLTGITPGSFDLGFNLILRQIVNFAVPTFLALAGYFDGRSAVRSVPARLWRLLPPYIFWTVVFVALLKPSHFGQPVNLVIDFAAGAGIGIGYFVVVLVQMIFLMTLFERVTPFVQVIVMICMFVLGTALTYANEMLGAWNPIEFPYNVLIFVVWYPFYHFGFLVARSKDLQLYLSRISPALLLAAIGGFLVSSIIEAIVIQHQNVLHAASQLKATSKLTSLAMIVLIFSVHANVHIKSGLLTWIGRNSYFIYLFHLLPITVATKVFSDFLGSSSQLVATPAKFAFALAVSLVSAWVARRLIPEKVQRYILG